MGETPKLRRFYINDYGLVLNVQEPAYIGDVPEFQNVPDTFIKLDQPRLTLADLNKPTIDIYKFPFGIQSADTIDSVNGCFACNENFKHPNCIFYRTDPYVGVDMCLTCYTTAKGDLKTLNKKYFRQDVLTQLQPIQSFLDWQPIYKDTSNGNILYYCINQKSINYKQIGVCTPDFVLTTYNPTCMRLIKDKTDNMYIKYIKIFQDSILA